MVWVKGRGYQRASSYRHHAAVAEMQVALRSLKPVSPISLGVALTSRIAGYAIRTSGSVGGGGREVTLYPYNQFVSEYTAHTICFLLRISRKCLKNIGSSSS